MLNELFSLNSSMEAAGISSVSLHKHYKTCRKGNCFFLLIAPDGTVADLEPLKDLERIQSIRRYAVSNNFSFPAFNIPALFIARNDNAKRALKDLRNLLGSRNIRSVNRAILLSKVGDVEKMCDSLWTQSLKDRIKKCLASAGLRQKLGNALEQIPNDYSAFSELIKRSETINPDKMHDQIHSIIIRKLQTFPEQAPFWIDTLAISSSEKKVSIVLELADQSSFLYPANHKRVVSWVNSILMQASHPPMREKVSDPQNDAFGQPITDLDLSTKLPSVNLPRLGDTKLRAMHKQSPCRRRYNTIESRSFPVGETARQAMKNSLEWLGNGSRRGKTWEDISNACGYDRALLFAYPSKLSDDPPEFAGLFQASAADGQKFEDTAARVLQTLKGISQDSPNTQMRIFALAKVDKARTKLLLSKDYSVSALLKGAEDWQTGCENMPLIKLNIGSEASPFWIEPITPFPTQAVKSLNVAWLEGGKRTNVVHGLGIGEGVTLLLETGFTLRQTVNRALSLLLVNSKPLLLAIGHADHRRDGSTRLDSRHSIHANLVPSLLGLLLYKQNVKKGMYMHSASFLVGRLFALADLLHKEYCKHVRKDSLPSQLIGNALMPSVIDNPERGLARLGERLRIYQSWANTAQGRDFRCAKWVLSQMGKVSSELASIDLPDRTNDADKAQMLLGYLARSEAKEIEKLNNSTAISNQEGSNVQ